jgi:hypothetical protein
LAADGPFSFISRWKVSTMSAEVSGLPSENFSPLRSVNSQFVESAFAFQDCARSGSSVPVRYRDRARP